MLNSHKPWISNSQPTEKPGDREDSVSSNLIPQKNANELWLTLESRSTVEKLCWHKVNHENQVWAAEDEAGEASEGVEEVSNNVAALVNNKAATVNNNRVVTVDTSKVVTVDNNRVAFMANKVDTVVSHNTVDTVDNNNSNSRVMVDHRSNRVSEASTKI